MSDLFVRFIIGGVVVSLFASLGDLFRPKSFAGLFAAAPSIALASIGLAIHKHGRAYAAVEGRSMVFGSLAFLFYALAVSWILRRFRPASLLATIFMMPVWFGLSAALWWLLLRSA